MTPSLLLQLILFVAIVTETHQSAQDHSWRNIQRLFRFSNSESKYQSKFKNKSVPLPIEATMTTVT